MRTFLALFIAVLFFCVSLMPAGAGELPDSGSFFRVLERQAETISEGVTLSSYALTVNERPVRMSVLEIDLDNPYVELRSLVGTDGTLAETRPVSKMAERTGAVAAVNGGFFIRNQGKPLGMVVKDGELVSGPIMRADMPVFALDLHNRPVMDFFKFSGSVTAGNGETYPLYGVNKLFYNLENGSLSDTDRLTLYNQYWGPLSRGGSDAGLAGVLEAVVADDGTVVNRVYEGKPVVIPEGGFVLRGHGSAVDFILENLAVGTRVKADYRTTPDFEKIKLSTGSNSFLVQEGRVAAFQEVLRGQNARTAVAAAENGRVLYLVAVAVNEESTGVEQEELAELLVAMGVEEALNLDGGGSTTMVARYLGDTELSAVVQPQGGWQRPVPDSLGIFNTAPSGRPAGLIVSGPDTLLPGTTAEYTVKGYDTHFYPWQPGTFDLRVARGDGTASGGVFTAGSGGEVVLEFTSGGVREQKKVYVVEDAAMKSLRVTPSLIVADCGQTVPLAFTLETFDGREFPLEEQYIEVRASQTVPGAVYGDKFVAGQVRGSGTLEVIYRDLAAQVPVMVGSLFSDTEDNWAGDQIEEMARAGIIKGFTDGTYRPAEPVTRAQLVTMLDRLLQWSPGSGQEEPCFEDQIPAWAEDAVAAAVARGVVRGYPDGKFRPDRPVTRAEVAVILEQAVELTFSSVADLDFTDAGDIPEWAREAVERVVSAGVLRGYEDGLLRPEAHVTRAETAVLFARLNGLN